MLGYDALPSFDTTRGKLCWVGIFGLLTVTFAVSAAYGAVTRRK